MLTERLNCFLLPFLFSVSTLYCSTVDIWGHLPTHTQQELGFSPRALTDDQFGSLCHLIML